MPVIDLQDIEPALASWGDDHPPWGWGGNPVPGGLSAIRVGDLVRVKVHGQGVYFGVTRLDPPTGKPQTIEAVHGWVYEKFNQADLGNVGLEPGQVYSFPAGAVYEIPKPVLKLHDLLDRQSQVLFPEAQKDSGV